MNSDALWKVALGIVSFVLSLFVFEELALKLDDIRLRPYLWECERCAKRGSPTGCSGNDANTVEQFKTMHDRAVHLEEV